MHRLGFPEIWSVSENKNLRVLREPYWRDPSWCMKNWIPKCCVAELKVAEYLSSSAINTMHPRRRMHRTASASCGAMWQKDPRLSKTMRQLRADGRSASHHMPPTDPRFPSKFESFLPGYIGAGFFARKSSSEMKVLGKIRRRMLMRWRTKSRPSSFMLFDKPQISIAEDSQTFKMRS